MAADQNKRNTFSGRGFSEEEFTPGERSELRERAYHYDRHFLSSQDFLDETGLGWLSSAAKGFPAFLKVFGVISAIGGAYIALAATGVLN